MTFSPAFKGLSPVASKIHIFCYVLVLSLSAIPLGCGLLRAKQARAGIYDPSLLQAVDLSQPVNPIALSGAVDLSAARNEWASFCVRVARPASPSKKQQLRVTLLNPVAAGSPVAMEAYQVLAMPVDLNRAGLIRHTGVTNELPAQPRALLPLTAGKDGLIDLNKLRLSSADEAVLIWFDLRLPADAPAGQYAGRCDLLLSGSTQASVEVRLNVYDFTLPAERHLQFVSALDWSRLAALYPDRFETVRPTLLNRDEPRFARAVRTLDQFVALAQANRCEVFIPRLGPTVKWPAGQKPDVDWEDFVSMIGPWMKGDAFADGEPLGFWPIPKPDQLARYDRQSQLDYFTNAANRFDQMDWLTRSAVLLDLPRPGRAGPADSIELSSLAAQVLSAQPRVRVGLPLEDDQLLLANPNRQSMIEPATAGRLICSVPGLVFAPPMVKWSDDTPRPRHWLRADLPGLVPYAGAGADERDVRLFAWLAYLRSADLVMCGPSLPMVGDTREPADPDDLTWFYPGEWFGLDQPVPTLQLKWLRRAEQDYEYLLLAKSRGDRVGPLLTARAITKPVQILNSQSPDPVYSMMSGTVDPAAWQEVKELLARRILLRTPGNPIDPEVERQLNLQSQRWLEPQDRQYQLARSSQFVVDPMSPDTVGIKLGLDIYNASDDTPGANSVGWTKIPDAWTYKPQELALPSLGRFEVNRTTLDAQVRLSRLSAESGGSSPTPLEWTFTNGYTHKSYGMRAVLPVAPSDRRQTPLKIDGSLEDWDAADAIQNGPMTRFMSRPALQRQQLEPATNPARLYTAWADENLYLAFRLQGVTTPQFFATQNFVNYQNRRAWGEDLCELLIQPQYADNSLGPVMHIVCKTTELWVEKRLNPKLFADPWQPIEGLSIRYGRSVDGGVWRGELAIPWKAMLDEKKDRPTVLRFNVTHHIGATGESASWAGPIDYGRDESLMGLLYLRNLDASFAPKPRQPSVTDGK